MDKHEFFKEMVEPYCEIKPTTDEAYEIFLNNVAKECIEIYNKGEVLKENEEKDVIRSAIENYYWLWQKSVIDRYLEVSDCFINYYEKQLRATDYPVGTIEQLIESAIKNEQYQTYLMLIKYKHEKYDTPAQQFSV